MKKEIREVQQDSSDGQIDAMLRRWFFEDKGSVEVSVGGGFVCVLERNEYELCIWDIELHGNTAYNWYIESELYYVCTVYMCISVFCIY